MDLAQWIMLKNFMNAAPSNELQMGPIAVTAMPAVGKPLNYKLLSIGSIMTNPNHMSARLSGTDTGLQAVSAGTYLMSTTMSSTEINAVEAYICTFDFNNSKPTYTSVEPWDGQVDIHSDSFTFSFGFTMPDLSKFGSQSQIPSVALVFYMYKK